MGCEQPNLKGGQKIESGAKASELTWWHTRPITGRKHVNKLIFQYFPKEKEMFLNSKNPLTKSKSIWRYKLSSTIKISLSVLQDRLLKIKESQKDIVVSLILPKTSNFYPDFCLASKMGCIKTIKAQYYTNEDFTYITKYLYLCF